MARLRAIASSQGPSAPRPASKAARPIPDSEKCLLNELLSDAVVPNHSQNHGVGEPSEAVIEIRHRLRLPALQAPCEFLIVLPA